MNILTIQPMKLTNKQKVWILLLTCWAWIPFAILWFYIVDIYDATIDN